MSADVPIWALAPAVLVPVAVAAAVWYQSRRREREELEALAAQVRAVSEGRFEQRTQPPQASLQPLARAINVMAAQLAQLFAERDAQVGALRNEAERDPLTGLASRAPFMARVADRVADDRASSGTLAILRLHDLVGLNRRFGRDRGTELLLSVAALLRLRAVRFERTAGAAGVAEPVAVARLNGADFGLLLPPAAPGAAEAWLADLVRALRALPVLADAGQGRVGWIGASRWRPGESMADLMARADAMLQACETADVDWRCAEPEQEGVMSVTRWRVALEDALGTGRVSLALQAVEDRTGSRVLMHAVPVIELPDGRRLEGDEFVAPAARCMRRPDVDLRVVELAVDALGREEGSIQVEVGWESALRPNFLLRLGMVLERAGPAAARLLLAVDVRAGRHGGLAPLAPLFDLLRRHGVRAALDGVDGPFSDLNELGRMGLTSLILDEAMCTGIAAPAAAGQRQLAAILVQVAHAQGLSVAARDIGDLRDLRSLWELGIDRVTGPALRAVPAEQGVPAHGAFELQGAS
jgi:GGDEF domain-containing protein/EAL domain-containing protein (putative c-di-GMP-specific phosphodiesterase class I)